MDSKIKYTLENIIKNVNEDLINVVFLDAGTRYFNRLHEWKGSKSFSVTLEGESYIFEHNDDYFRVTKGDHVNLDKKEKTFKFTFREDKDDNDPVIITDKGYKLIDVYNELAKAGWEMEKATIKEVKS